MGQEPLLSIMSYIFSSEPEASTSPMDMRSTIDVNTLASWSKLDVATLGLQR